MTPSNLLQKLRDLDGIPHDGNKPPVVSQPHSGLPVPARIKFRSSHATSPTRNGSITLTPNISPSPHMVARSSPVSFFFFLFSDCVYCARAWRTHITHYSAARSEMSSRDFRRWSANPCPPPGPILTLYTSSSSDKLSARNFYSFKFRLLTKSRFPRSFVPLAIETPHLHFSVHSLLRTHQKTGRTRWISEYG